MKIIKIGCVVLYALAMIASSAFAAQPAQKKTRSMGAVKKTQECFETAKKKGEIFDITLVDHKNGAYVEGEYCEFEFVAPMAGYVSVWYFDAGGHIIKLVPNQFMPGNPTVKAGEKVKLPPDDDDYALQVMPPFGKEKLVVLISHAPFGTLPEGKYLPDKLMDGYQEVEPEDYETVYLNPSVQEQRQPNRSRGIRVVNGKKVPNSAIPNIMIGIAELTTHEE